MPVYTRYKYTPARVACQPGIANQPFGYRPQMDVCLRFSKNQPREVIASWHPFCERTIENFVVGNFTAHDFSSKTKSVKRHIDARA